MGGTGPSAVTRTVPTAELTRSLAERAPAERRPAVEAFAHAYTRRLGPAELADLRPPELAGQVAGAFALANSRDGADVAVRAFNPDAERDGYVTVGSVLEVNRADSPFLFDSLNEELEARGLRLRRVVHPVIGTRRGPDGRIQKVLDAREPGLRESVMHFEVDRRLGESELADRSDSPPPVPRAVG